MPVIEDKEFGKITIRRSAQARAMRIRVAPNGTLRVSAPQLAPVFMIKRMIASSRRQLREMLSSQRPVLAYTNGSEIGKSHSLLVRRGIKPKVEREGVRIIVTLPEGLSLENDDIQAELRTHVIEALRREAKGYLPRRLAYLADLHGCSYRTVRFSHASGRWGSCSSAGTISLNIALMKLPFELIDYVLLHELAHTIQMNHSEAFWHIVESYDPAYKKHRKLLKNETPTI